MTFATSLELGCWVLGILACVALALLPMTWACVEAIMGNGFWRFIIAVPAFIMGIGSDFYLVSRVIH